MDMRIKDHFQICYSLMETIKDFLWENCTARGNYVCRPIFTKRGEVIVQNTNTFCVFKLK